MVKEIWGDIPEFEGEYQASTFGRVRSLDVLKEYVNFKGTYCKHQKLLNHAIKIIVCKIYL